MKAENKRNGLVSGGCTGRRLCSLGSEHATRILGIACAVTCHDTDVNEQCLKGLGCDYRLLLYITADVISLAIQTSSLHDGSVVGNKAFNTVLLTSLSV